MLTVRQATEFKVDADKGMCPRLVIGDTVLKVLHDDDGGRYLYIRDYFRNTETLEIFQSATIEGLDLIIAYQHVSMYGTDQYLLMDLPLKVSA